MESFYRVVNGDYIIKEAYKIFPKYLYYFLIENLRTINTKFLRYKIIDKDVKKFLKGKPTLTREDIL